MGASFDPNTSPLNIVIDLEITQLNVINSLDMSILRDGVVQFAQAGIVANKRIELNGGDLKNGTYTLLVIARDAQGTEW